MPPPPFRQDFEPRIHLTQADFASITQRGLLCDADGQLTVAQFEARANRQRERETETETETETDRETQRERETEREREGEGEGERKRQRQRQRQRQRETETERDRDFGQLTMARATRSGRPSTACPWVARA